MKTEIKIEACPSPYCVLHAQEETEAVTRMAEKIRMMDLDGNHTTLTGWDGDYSIPLRLNDIFRIYSQDKKVYVETEEGSLLLKMRLYEFEGLAATYGWTSFIRISNTDIVNFTNVSKLDMSLSGIIRVLFKNGGNAMVSRRYMNKIREQLCLKKH